MKRNILFITACCIVIGTLQAQVGFKKDSLQIKVYTEVDYKGNRPTKIKVTKVFCDYCNEKQIQFLSQEAWHITYINRYDYQEKIKKGKAKLAHYIRVSKKNFKNIQ